MDLSLARARVGIGMTLYNNAGYLPEAIDSLLNQSWRDFALVLVDDYSSDNTEAVARSYAARDARVRYFRNDRRLGLIGTWRQAFHRVREVAPSIQYFAWASDHDRWAPDWLEKLYPVVAANPSVVLAYSLAQKMTAEGDLHPEEEQTSLHTAGLAGINERWAVLCRDLKGAGNMVYGLFRASALERAGVYRDVVLPDRLLIAELALHGHVVQVPEVLYFRRELGPSTIERQRQTLFGPRRAPLHAYVPWPMVHAANLLKYTVTTPPAGLSRPAVAGLSTRYVWTQLAVYYGKIRLKRKRHARAVSRQQKERAKAEKRAAWHAQKRAARSAAKQPSSGAGSKL